MSNNLTFAERCYQLLLQIPKGKVTTYGEIARALGTTASRAVGTAMAKNKNLVTVPCYRVVRSNGEIGQYAQGAEEKEALLRSEGVIIKNGKVVGLEAFFHAFK